MLLLGILLNIFIRGKIKEGVVPSLSPLPHGFVDCVEAERGCKEDPRCKELYMTLEYCASEEAVAPLGNKASIECLEALSGLHYLPLLACKCQRGARREEHCLKVYWSIRILQGYDDFEGSPYEDSPVESSRMASLVAAASSLLLDGQNVCLKAAQDCGLYEKCGSLRSEYVLACTKHAPGSDHCNRQKCLRALRRFLERVPEEYSLGLLFCPCTDKLCGERRRKTIVPSCSYQERDLIQPNCLLLQSFCKRDQFCRSRLADFQHNCQPSGHSPSGCIRESGAVCLKSYAGLIGTIMTPNYVSNSTVEVDLWCNCEGSGNQWQDCLRIQHMFTNNACLENSISTMGISPPRPVESTFPPPSRPSPLDQQNELSNNAQDEVSNNAVEQSEEEEDVKEEEGGQFDVIPLYAEKATVSNLGSGGGGVSPRLSIGPPPSLLLLLLLLSASLSWGPPGFDLCLFSGLHSCLP
ncbi:GDNF family receptor alpha-4-like isoform X1 [Salvelinus fontinalis]|uniref:GDNF family receptor alpha-4-like isoform X1 n=1 Tax=Salvelinus fontinalis TaxID=8038 RepID=UPI002486B534|nr:GDNF family receptor alpha-4-like isoform X1 [Salvelinus fontinalis]